MLNFACYIGHSSLRLYVMGDAAYERAATAEEIDEMCRLWWRRSSAGAAGFSTSFAYTHRGMDGLPVPSRFAERDEVEALFLAAGSTGKGVVLATAGEQCTYADMYECQPRIGRPFTYPLFALADGRHRPQLELHEQAVARGCQVWPQVTPRPLTMQFTMDEPVQPQREQGVRRADGPGPRRPDRRLQRSRPGGPGRRPTWPRRTMKPRWETCEVSESDAFPELEGKRVDDLAAGAGLRARSTSSVSWRWPRTWPPGSGSTSPTTSRTAWATSSPTTRSSSVSPTPAPTSSQLCDAPLPTDLLGTWVRDRGVMPLERAVRKLSGEAADMFGFVRRGYLREGNWADVCVFDPATVAPGPTPGCGTSRPAASA